MTTSLFHTCFAGHVAVSVSLSESVGFGGIKTLCAQAGLFSLSQPSTCFIIQFLFHTLPLLDFLLCYYATYLQLILFSSLLLFSMCYTETPHVFSNTPTHAHTHTFQNTKHTPQVRWAISWDSVVISHYCVSKPKHTFTLADNNRLTQFRSISIIKVIYHIRIFFFTPRQMKWVNLGE